MNPYREVKKRHRQKAQEFAAWTRAGPSTLRIFPAGSHKALAEYFQLLATDSKLIRAREEPAFDKRLQFWSGRFPREARYGRKMKAINLLLRALVFTRDALPLQQAKRVESLLHLP